MLRRNRLEESESDSDVSFFDPELIAQQLDDQGRLQEQLNELKNKNRILEQRLEQLAEENQHKADEISDMRNMVRELSQNFRTLQSQIGILEQANVREVNPEDQPSSTARILERMASLESQVRLTRIEHEASTQRSDSFIEQVQTQMRVLHQSVLQLNSDSSSIKVLTGSYSAQNVVLANVLPNKMLPLPDGYTSEQCHFLWICRVRDGRRGAGHVHYSPAIGNTRNFGEAGRPEAITWMVVGIKPALQLEALAAMEPEAGPNINHQ